MRDKNEELIGKLHSFADWLEGANHVHCDSIPRQAANTISRLEEENYQMRLRLNKRYVTVGDIVNRVIGKIRLWWYIKIRNN